MSAVPGEETLLEVHPVMFRNNPLLFLLAALTVVGLLIWWLSTKASKLTVTNKRSIQRKGLIAKFTTEVLHRDVRNIQVDQSAMQRLLGVGSLGISSAGQAGVEIQIEGVRDPAGIKALIDRHRAL